MRRLLSLFDYSGQWSQPFEDAGWDVIRWDIKLQDFMDINLITDAEVALELFEDVNGIIAGVPCTDFTVSGAWTWPAKDSDGRTAASVQLVRQVQRLVDLFAPTDPDYDDVWFWAIENPVGRIDKLCGLGPAYWFHPYEFAGYVALTNEQQLRLALLRTTPVECITTDDAMFIMETNCYTKKTGLWGHFNRELIKKPLSPIQASKQGSPLQKLGGKSDRTKELRSITPIGFATSFFNANQNFKHATQHSNND